MKESYPSGTASKLLRLQVPGCVCKVDYGSGNIQDCICKLQPCTIRAFKNLQTLQLTHTNTISKLETTMEQFQVALSSLGTSPGPHIELDSDGAVYTGFVQEEVHKWLVGVKSLTATV